MTGIWMYVWLIVGFVLLVKGADFFVDGSSSVAKKLRIPSMIIGLTIVSMGTSLPEAAVSITASVTGNNAMAVSNVVGSNIFNLMVVCGACALFMPLTVKENTLKKDFPFSILVTLLLLGLGYWGMAVGRIDGIVFLVIFVGFLVWMVRSALAARKSEAAAQTVLTGGGSGGQTVAAPEAEAGQPGEKILPVWQCVLYILGGAAAIALGGDLVVDSASAIASQFGLSQNLIGLTIVAMGTSLPELVTSLVAAHKKEVDMALGNVIGSNIFNILFVLGIAASISPIEFIMENVIDIVILLCMSIVVLGFAWSRKRLNRWEGAVMLLAYAGYMAYIIAR